MKTKTIISTILGMSLLYGLLPAQTEEFRFKLYMESLANGKKDTLELGVGPDGYGWGGNEPWGVWHDCQYDSTLCPVYTEPFFDTVEHIGAFVVPGTDAFREHTDTLRVLCPFYAKKRIGLLGVDMVVVLPASARPVKVSWDRELMQSPIVETPILTTFEHRARWDRDASSLSTLKVIMSDKHECEVGKAHGISRYDSVAALAYIKDSMGGEHPYVQFFILTGQDRHAAVEDKLASSAVEAWPNPVREKFQIRNSVALREWQVYSVTGKRMGTGVRTDTEIDCAAWPSGIYVLYWKAKDGQNGVVKLVKE